MTRKAPNCLSFQPETEENQGKLKNDITSDLERLNNAVGLHSCFPAAFRLFFFNPAMMHSPFTRLFAVIEKLSAEFWLLDGASPLFFQFFFQPPFSL